MHILVLTHTHTHAHHPPQKSKHLDSACEHRSFTCPDCSAETTPNKLASHLTLCPERLVECSHCQTFVPFSRLQFHYELECIERVLQCPVCLACVLCKDIEQHLRENAADHIAFYAAELQKADSSLHDHTVTRTAASPRLFVVAGHDGKTDLRSVQAFHPVFECWTPVASLHKSRSGFACCYIDNAIFAVGGEHGDTALASVECMRFNQRRLEELVWTYVAPMHSARKLFGAATLEGFVYAVGGVGKDGTMMDLVER